MIIGVPKETKVFENRVGLTPDAVAQLKEAGATVLVEKGAGVGSGFSDAAYRKAGARLLSNRRDVYQKSELIVKVKEPQPQEYSFYRHGLVLFTFLHLAANRSLLKELLKRRVIGIAYETIENKRGQLPVLAPMSEIAGTLAGLIGANYLRKDLGGKGKLLAVNGLGKLGRVTVIGAGHVGMQSIRVTHGLGAHVSVYEINTQKHASLLARYPERLEIISKIEDLPKQIRETDLLIGSILISGEEAPKIVTRAMVRTMEPGSVIVDVAVDQGGCVATTKPTTLKSPTFIEYGVVHYGVTNMPSLAPRTATEALSHVTLPYLLKMVQLGVRETLDEDPGFAKGLNVDDGKIICPALFN